MDDPPDALPKASAKDSATSGTLRRVTPAAAPVVAKPTEFGEMLASISSVAIWLIFLIGQGLTAGLETIWLLVIGLPLGAWTMLMRLRFSHGTLMFTIGPWRRTVDLSALDSVKWKMTGGGLSRGTYSYATARAAASRSTWAGSLESTNGVRCCLPPLAKATPASIASHVISLKVRALRRNVVAAGSPYL